MATSKNLKTILQPITSIPSVEGVLLVDNEGMVLESTFSSDQDPEQLGSIFAIIDLNVKGQLTNVGESVSQLFIGTPDKLILVQKIDDVLLVLYTKKENLALLQSNLQAVADEVHQFLNISASNS